MAKLFYAYSAIPCSRTSFIIISNNHSLLFGMVLEGERIQYFDFNTGIAMILEDIDFGYLRNQNIEPNFLTP